MGLGLNACERVHALLDLPGADRLGCRLAPALARRPGKEDREAEKNDHRERREHNERVSDADGNVANDEKNLAHSFLLD